MMKTLDAAFCRKMNTNPGLFCVPFLCDVDFFGVVGFFFLSPHVMFFFASFCTEIPAFSLERFIIHG